MSLSEEKQREIVEKLFGLRKDIYANKVASIQIMMEENMTKKAFEMVQMVYRFCVSLEQIYFPDDIIKFDEAYIEKVAEKNDNQTEQMD